MECGMLLGSTHAVVVIIPHGRSDLHCLVAFSCWQAFSNLPYKNNTMEPRKDSTLKMATLSQAVNKAVDEGYTEDFQFTAGRLTTHHKDHYTPTDITIQNFYRFEGYSDPEDNAILYLIETTDGKKGTLIDAYGTYADAKLATFIRAVEQIQKK